MNGHYTGAWAVDIEADGDLDIVLGSSEGRPIVLRNNGDGTFTAIYPFAGISGVRGLVWADLNGDGNPDASFIDGSGHLHVFLNERSGRFVEIPAPAGLGQIKAIAAGDASHTGILDLVAVKIDGAIVSLALRNDERTWDMTGSSQGLGSIELSSSRSPPAGCRLGQQWRHRPSVGSRIAGCRERCSGCIAMAWRHPWQLCACQQDRSSASGLRRK